MDCTFYIVTSFSLARRVIEITYINKSELWITKQLTWNVTSSCGCAASSSYGWTKQLEIRKYDHNACSETAAYDCDSVRYDPSGFDWCRNAGRSNRRRTCIRPCSCEPIDGVSSELCDHRICHTSHIHVSLARTPCLLWCVAV